jgi:hypothetical protein
MESKHVPVIKTVDQSDGSCDVHFTAEVAGGYLVHILVGPNKVLLPGSPLSLTVEPGPPCVETMQVAIDGATYAR